MNRATIFQAAVAAILFGLFLVLAGMGPAPNPPPTPLRSYRPATEEERRRHDAELLREEMDRLWEQHHR